MAQIERNRTGSSRRPRRRPAKKNTAPNRTVLIVSICAAVLVLLVGAIVGMIVLLNKDKDNEKILYNVTAGGVNLGGMTKEEAKNALHLATDGTFSQKDMVIKLPDATIVLSPDETMAKLNVDAVVEEAYAYGRTGTEEEREAAKQSAATTIHTIALLPYLNLDLPYIQTSIREFCNSYSSIMTQPKVSLSGDRPTYNPAKPNQKVTHQTLTITMGTPNYILNADTLYNRVLDAYSLNELELNYQAPTLTEPQKLSAESIFAQHCLWPEDAVMDDITFEVTPEVYGYGFDVEQLQSQIDAAEYGQVIELKLKFLMPRITAKDLTKDLFLDMIASSSTQSNMGSAWNNNLELSCEAINNYVVKAGERFSFNLVLGRPSADKGYQKAPGYRSGKDAQIMGSGISQTASTLYYCLLKANLKIEERHCSGFAPSYADLGLDACIDWGIKDLSFVNNTKSPIRIVATAEGGKVTIQLFGIDELNYDVQLKTETTAQHSPRKIYQIMDRNNKLEFADGHLLQSGITGYDVDTYMLKYDKQTGALISNTKISTSNYASRDQILVKLAPETPVTSDPTTDSTTDSSVDPSTSSDPDTPDA